jgi:lipoyl(octanoyl) transferase
VIYPVLNIQKRGILVSEYIHLLAEAARLALKRVDVHANWDPERPGLYVDGKKIASMGLRVSRGVVSHGLSVNISGSIPEFDHIVPCRSEGLQNVSVEMLTGVAPEPWAVGLAVIEALQELLGTA